MTTLTKDDVWKVVQMALGILVIPLAGWVWNMNVEVADLFNRQLKLSLNHDDPKCVRDGQSNE